MATYTTNYNLKKPADGDFINIADLNGNADIIDEELKKRPVVGEDGKLPDSLLPDLADTYEEKGAAEAAVSAHNKSTNAHNDIRIELGKKAPVPIIGTAPPTTSTVGVVGQEYIDTSSKRTWRCAAISGGTYTWVLYDAGVSSKFDVTLSASGWTANKTYTITSPYITATSAVEILPRENKGVTREQMDALAAAMIVGGTQSNGSIELVSLDILPEIDLPLTVIVRRDL